MKRAMRFGRSIGWLWTLLMALGSGCAERSAAEPRWGFCEPNLDEPPVRPAPEEEASLPFLRVVGTEILDEQDRPVALRGFNFGSWLMMESWIPGIGLLDEQQLLDMIPGKAAEHGVAELVAAARAANAFEWLTEERSHWVLIQEWRAYCDKHASAAERPGLDRFWAWFDSEPWIFEERSLWNWLGRRFGYERSQALRAAFHDAYITEEDVERLAGLGLNLIRVPIWFELLETDFLGGSHYKPEGFRRLDELARWARRHRVYLMLDLHGAPGGQSTSWHQGLEDGGALFSTPACVQKTARLWRAIAGYFRDDPHVAVYDLLNEPMAARDEASYREVHDALYRAIREVDERHIVMAEDGYRSPQTLAFPREMGWENAMYSIHLYSGGTSAEDYLRRVEVALERVHRYYDRVQAPLFLGEFNAAEAAQSGAWAAEAMDLTLARLNQRGIHWAPWTWKYHDDDTPWGLLHPRQTPGARIDVKDASFERIRADFGALSSAGFRAEPVLEAAVRSHATAPARPLDLGPLPP